MERVRSLKGSKTPDEGFAGWLLAEKYRDLVDLAMAAEDAATVSGGARTYRHVAVLGYAVAAGQKQPQVVEALRNGLDWISGRVPFAQSSPGFEVDATALLGLALGAHESANDPAKRWMAGFLPKSAGTRLKPWDLVLVSAAARVIGQPALVSAPRTPETADLRIALRSRGVDIEVQDDDEAAALNAALGGDDGASGTRQAVFIRVLDWLVHETCILNVGRPTAGDVLHALERVPASMRRWRWDEKSSSKAPLVRWSIDNEYHVQDLLWVILAPLFPDLEDEENLPSLGHKHPRCDIGIPSLHLIIEVKFLRQGTQGEFAKMTEELAADHTLYLRSGSSYSTIIAFLWDDSCSVEHHEELKQALRQMPGVLGTVIMSRPAKMKRG
jgi:hypothetical protein